MGLTHRAWFFVICLIPWLANATPTQLGDLDDDGVFTANDLAKLVGHSSGTTPLLATLQPFADLTQDGFINDADHNALVSLILESSTPQNLPLASIREVSPATGEGDVAVTRETVLHFSMPLALNAALDTSKLYAEFGGRKILSRVEISSDKKKATLFYLEPLPSNARIRVSFDSTGVNDLLGRAIDGDGDGLAGGSYITSFDTLSITAVAGTAISGRVFASERGTGGNEVPLANVTVTVDGAEQTLRTTTDALGNFTLSPCPAGSFFVHIDGRTSPQSAWPGGDYYPNVGKRWEALAGRTDNLSGNPEDTSRGTIYLPKVLGAALQTVSQTQETEVEFPPAVLAANPALAGTELIVPANSLFADDGTRGGRVGIAPVAPDRLPSPLPPGLNLPMVITIQTDGATNFDRPVPICFPNLPDPETGEKLPPGAKSALWSFNHDLGDWEVVGPMTVTEDGNFVKTDSGVGVRQPGWHGQQPGSQMTGAELVDSSRGCGPGVKTVLKGVSTAADCASDFFGIGQWLKCGSGLVKVATSAMDFGETVKNDQSVTSLTGFNSTLGLASASVGAVIDCTIAGAGTATGASQVLAVVSCTSGVLDTVDSYLAEIPQHCTGQKYSRVVSEVAATVGVLDAALSLEEALRLYDAKSAQSVIRTDLASINLVRSGIDVIITAAKQSNPGNPNPPLTPTQKQQVEDYLTVSAPILQRMQTSGKVFQTLEQKTAQTEELLAESLTLSGDMLRESSKPTNAAPPDIRITISGATPSDPPIVLTPRPGANGQLRVPVPPNRPYTMTVFHRATGAIETIHGWTGRNGSSFSVPPIDISPPTNPHPPLPDEDGDGLVDAAEYVIGTNKSNPDTDGDGINDGAEVKQGTDPLNGLIATTGIIASVPTSGSATDVCALNNLAVTANGTAGISVFNVLSGLNPTRIADVNTPGAAVAVACSGNLVTVADYEAGVALVDLSDPTSIGIRQQIALGSPVQTVTMNGPLVYAGMTNGQVAMLDAATGTILARTTLPGTGAVQDLAVGKDRLYALQAGRLSVLGLETLSVSGSLTLGGQIGAGGRRMRLFAGEDTLYATHMRGFTIFDTSTSSPVLVRDFSTTQFGWKHIVANGSGLGIAATSPNSTNDGPHDMDLYTLGSDQRTPAFTTTFVTPGLAAAVSIYNGLAYVADSGSGLQVVSYLPYDNLGQAPSISLTASIDLGTAQVEEGKLTRLGARVTDDVQVKNVEFYLDGTLALVDGGYPFEHRFISPARSASKTSFTVRAKATDTGGNIAWTPATTIQLVTDATAPTLLSLNPSAGSLVGQIQTVYARFNEPMDVSTLTSGGLRLITPGPDTLYDTADDLQITGGTLSFQESSNTAFIHWPSTLTPGTYQFRATTSARDMAGNALASRSVATFRVASGNDRDNDGVPDDWETLLGMDPDDNDSDNDGILDGNEDRDGDTVKNSLEIALGFNPFVQDSDGDGIRDDREDQDGDGLRDWQEIGFGTNVALVDSDGDGLDDGSEIADGTSPTSAASARVLSYRSAVISYINNGPEPLPAGLQVHSSVPVAFLNIADAPLPAGIESVRSPVITFLNTSAEPLPSGLPILAAPTLSFLNAASSPEPAPAAVSPIVSFSNQPAP